MGDQHVDTLHLSEAPLTVHGVAEDEQPTTGVEDVEIPPVDERGADGAVAHSGQRRSQVVRAPTAPDVELGR
jgi:hypothetical protein